MKSTSVCRARADVVEHRRHVRVGAGGGLGLSAVDGVDVHLPRILVQLDAGRCGNPLALVHQVADEQAEVGRRVDARRTRRRAAGR